jgi:hypothetical protein
MRQPFCLLAAGSRTWGRHRYHRARPGRLYCQRPMSPTSASTARPGFHLAVVIRPALKQRCAATPPLSQVGQAGVQQVVRRPGEGRGLLRPAQQVFIERSAS